MNGLKLMKLFTKSGEFHSEPGCERKGDFSNQPYLHHLPRRRTNVETREQNA